MSTAAMWAVLFLLAPPCGAPAEVSGPREESEVKAAMLFNFARFVEWPQGATGNLTFGILADQPFPGIFERMVRGRSVNGRPVMVKNVVRPAETGGCDIVFLSEVRRHQWRQVQEAIAGRSVLTVSDMPDFTARGGIIGIFQESSRLRFEVNLAAARSAGLRLWAQLLKLGRVVEYPPPKVGR